MNNSSDRQPPSGCPTSSFLAAARWIVAASLAAAVFLSAAPAVEAASWKSASPTSLGRGQAVSLVLPNGNVLVMGAEKLPAAQAKRIAGTWLATDFEAGGRHARRVKQIAAIERRYSRR